MKQRVKKIWASKSVAIPLVTVLAATIAVVVFSTFNRAGETAVEHRLTPSEAVELGAPPAPAPVSPREVERRTEPRPVPSAQVEADARILAGQLENVSIGGDDWAASFQQAGSTSRWRAPVAPARGSGSKSRRTAPAAGSSAGTATATPAATNFRDYLRTRAVSTDADAVSTFSLDTDRTSFQLALNWVNSGYAVEPDSVRAEEWINAFDYQYDQPLRRDSFAVTSALVEHPLRQGQYLARLAFQAPKIEDDSPINVTLVMDASGSMGEGNRIAIAHAAAEAIRRSLRPQDRIAVVQFSNEVISELTVEHADPSAYQVISAIEALQPRNMTNVQAGLDLGVRLADQARRERPDAYNYLILFSDGVANVDATDPFGTLESVGGDAGDNPLRLITIGVGVENFNDYLLEQLAQHGNGWYRYLADVEQARATFARDNWLAISIPFADQARAQVSWDEDAVRSWRLIGYENRIADDAAFTQARREFAEIPAGSATTAFYEIELVRTPRPGQRLGEVELRWNTPLSGASNRQHAAILANPGGERQDSDALLRFGAIVALASDRYSSLPGSSAADRQVSSELAALRDELRYLENRLGGLNAFADFKTVLGHLAALPVFSESVRSGYSP